MPSPRWPAVSLSLSAISSALVAAAFVAAGSPAWAQFEETNTPGAKLDKTVVEKLRVGMTCTAVGGPCAGIVATMPVPTEWPEQKVTILKEDLSPTVRKIEYRTLSNGAAKQMIVRIPNLASGDECHAYVTFEVTRRTILPPDDTKIFTIAPHPEKEKEASAYLSPGPYIESGNPKIAKLAKDATEGKEGWAKVEAIYDTSQEKLTYKNGPLKGALKGLTDGWGDCEEYSSLFIAMCRAENIPARMVRVPGHVYSEFYLVDKDGKGYWFPVQSAGTKSFGFIPETRPILQKGDNFHDPDRPKEHLIYLNEFLHGVMKKGSGKPNVQFICEEEK